MLVRLYKTLTDKESFWREILKYGLLDKRRSPKDWFVFRHSVGKECALRREVPGSPATKFVEEAFPEIKKSECKLNFVRLTPYNLSWEEIVTISQLVSIFSPKSLFEFGTFNGLTTLLLAMNSSDDAVVNTIDIVNGEFDFGVDTPFFKKISVGEYFLGMPEARKVKQLTGDTTKFDFSEYDEKMDFIFVDGGHAYDIVMNDSEKAFKMIRPGGMIVWHDHLVIGDVTKAMIELNKDRKMVHLKGTSLVAWKDQRGNDAE